MTPNLNINQIRIPDTTTCFPWDTTGTATILQDEFDDITPSTGSVVVTRTGDETATSGYGYTFDIDFAGDEVRGDMDLRYGLARRICCFSASVSFA